MTTVGTVIDDRPTLGSIVGDADRFLGEAFGHSPWRGRSPSATRLCGLGDVDRIVTSAVRTPAIRMVRAGKRIPASEFCSPTRIGSATLDDVADVRKVLDLFRGGATLVLQSLHRTWRPLSAWCADLEREVGWPVQANAYLTPAGELGLAAHADRHDVLAIQLHGTKTWDVDGLGGIGLEPGDVLYLPAGSRHCAHTEARPSLHLTIGIHRPTPERIARAAASLAIERAPQPLDTTPEASVWLLRDSLGDVDADATIDRLRRPPRSHEEGLLTSSVTRPPVTAASLIAPNGPWSISSVEDRVVLTWPGGQLHLPDRTQPSIETLAVHAGPVPVGCLPGLDLEEQCVLARRLLDEHAATLVDDSPGGHAAFE